MMQLESFTIYICVITSQINAKIFLPRNQVTFEKHEMPHVEAVDINLGGSYIFGMYTFNQKQLRNFAALLIRNGETHLGLKYRIF